jgi:serine/threonine protein kinase
MSSKPIQKILNIQSPAEYLRSDFELQRKLGDGAFGQVWRARHKTTLKFFAVKQVQKTKVMRILEQFRREVEIMYLLDHPYLVKLFGHFEDEKFFYMVLELVEGGNLFQKLTREHVLSERQAAQYFREIVLAVEYLHTRTPVIIHRDIKPENIMIDKSGRVKLADFGWANYVNKTSERMTSCGTLEYLPPEMVDEKGHDTCVDIWCLGILLYEMLTGCTPFKASGKEKTMKNIMTSAIKFPLGFSHLAKDLIQKMLEREKNKRIDIFHVKIHRWLTIIQPIRETIVQNFTPKPLPEHQEKILKSERAEKPDEVKTTYSENDTDEDLKILAENAFRKSVSLLKARLEVNSNQVKSKRNSLKDSCEELAKLYSKCDELEGKIEEKKKELFLIIGKSKEILSKCFDLNLDLERLQNFDSNLLAEQVKNLQKSYNEKKKSEKLQQLHLQNLKNQVKSLTSTSQDLEKNLRSLKKNLQYLQDSSISIKSRKLSEIDELQVSLEVLHLKIHEKKLIITNFSQNDRNHAKGITELIQEKMENIQDFSRSLGKKLEKLEDEANEKEQQLSELSIDFEMKKSQKLHFLRKKKDEFSRNLRRTK